VQIRTLKGHTNEKNFVGLSVNSEYIACGSETNEVFVYHKVTFCFFVGICGKVILGILRDSMSSSNGTPLLQCVL
jgi:hypothetical protein